MSKYEPLNQFLDRLQADYWRPTFLELERILDFKLPGTARKNAAWWEKEAGGAARHAHAWADAGWKVQSVDLEKERVTFVRGDTPLPEDDHPDGGPSVSAAERLRSQAEALGDWASESRERALDTLKTRPLASVGASAGVAFAAGVGLGYLLFRALSAPASQAAHAAEDRARLALAALAEGVHDLADTVGERLRNLRG